MAVLANGDCTTLAKEGGERLGALPALLHGMPVDERFAQIFEAAPYAQVLVDAAGRIEMVNTQAERIFGYARAEMLGRPLEMLVPRQRRRRHAGGGESYAARHRRRTMDAGRELRGARKDGSGFPAEIGLNPVAAAGGAKVLATILDISERREAGRGLREREARLRSILTTAPDAIVVINEAGIIESFSPAAERLFGYKAAKAIGRNVKMLMPPPYCDREDAVIARFLRRGHRRLLGAGHAVAGRRRTGEVVPVELSVGKFRLGARRFFTGFARDLSERREAEARLARERADFEHKLMQSQKLEAIGQLTGGLAHDFNNLLGIIMGCLDLLRPQVPAQSDSSELLDDALDAARRGADLTRRLLIFARQQPLQSEHIDLAEVVANIVELLRRMLGEDIEIALDLASGTWPVIADAAQLQTSLANLAANARDAMPKGGTLTIATRNRRLDAEYASEHPEAAPGDYAMIEVGDNGTGMPADVLRHVFEPFYTTKERGKGTGLGLSMVFGFIKQSGGHVNVASEVGVGTTFRLYLPRAVAEDAAAAEPETAAAGRPAGETVLAVEDDRALRRVAVRQLRDLGYTVLEADGATAALAILERQQPDLMFSDVVMPGGIDGFELAREVRRRWPEVKVVLTSGFTGPRLDENLASLGQAVRLLGKPYRRVELARVLRDTLGH